MNSLLDFHSLANVLCFALTKYSEAVVAARFVTTARFVTKVTKRVKFDAQPARFVTPASFVTT